MVLMEFFMVSVVVAFTLQIIHSVLTKGGKFTFGFFGGGILFGYFRELAGPKAYSFPGAPLAIMGVPPFVPIGWVFTWYLGFELARMVLPPGEKFITVAATFSAFICIPVETAAMNCGWWVLTDWIITDAVAPVALIGGWFGSAVTFLCLVLIIRKEVPLKNLLVPLIVFIAQMIGPVSLLQLSVILGFAVIITLFTSIFALNRSLAVIIVTYLLVDLTNNLTYNYITNSVFVAIDFAVGLSVIGWLVLKKPKHLQLLESAQL